MNESGNLLVSDEPTQTRRNKSRIIFLVLCLVFAVPYAASLFYYYNQDVTRELETSNRGMLISPMRSWLNLELTDQIGNVIKADSFKGKWLLVTLAQSTCAVQCNDNLISMRQVRLALGLDRRHVERLLILTDNQDVVQLTPRLAEFGRMNALLADERQRSALESLLDYDGMGLLDAFFIIDPEGNYMMYYPAGTHPKALLKDMQRLMKVMEK